MAFVDPNSLQLHRPPHSMLPSVEQHNATSGHSDPLVLGSSEPALEPAGTQLWTGNAPSTSLHNKCLPRDAVRNESDHENDNYSLPSIEELLHGLDEGYANKVPTSKPRQEGHEEEGAILDRGFNNDGSTLQEGNGKQDSLGLPVISVAGSDAGGAAEYEKRNDLASGPPPLPLPFPPLAPFPLPAPFSPPTPFPLPTSFPPPTPSNVSLLSVPCNQIESDYDAMKNAGSDSIGEGEEEEKVDSGDGNGRDQKEGDGAETSTNTIGIRESPKNTAGNTPLHEGGGGTSAQARHPGSITVDEYDDIGDDPDVLAFERMRSQPRPVFKTPPLHYRLLNRTGSDKNDPLVIEDDDDDMDTTSVTAVSTTATSVDSNERTVDFHGLCSGELPNLDTVSPKPSLDVLDHPLSSNVTHNPASTLAKRHGSSSLKRTHDSTATDATEQDERRNAKRSAPASKGGFQASKSFRIYEDPRDVVLDPPTTPNNLTKHPASGNTLLPSRPAQSLRSTHQACDASTLLRGITDAELDSRKWEIEKIVDRRPTAAGWEYKVRWGESWVAEDDLEDAQDVVEEYHLRVRKRGRHGRGRGRQAKK